MDLVDAVERPNVFRIAPTDHGTAFRLAEYLIPKGLKVGLVVDDSVYGQEGAKALGESFASNPESVAINLTVPAARPTSPPRSSAPDAQMPQLSSCGPSRRRSPACSPLPAARAGTSRCTHLPRARIRSSDSSSRTTRMGGRPHLRSRPADGRGRARPFLSFQDKYEQRFGVQLVGVKTPDGDEVVQPPDYAMYSYDCVNVLAAAIERAGGPDDRTEVLDAR